MGFELNQRPSVFLHVSSLRSRLLKLSRIDILALTRRTKKRRRRKRLQSKRMKRQPKKPVSRAFGLLDRFSREAMTISANDGKMKPKGLCEIT